MTAKRFIKKYQHEMDRLIALPVDRLLDNANVIREFTERFIIPHLNWKIKAWIDVWFKVRQEYKKIINQERKVA